MSLHGQLFFFLGIHLSSYTRNNAIDLHPRTYIYYIFLPNAKKHVEAVMLEVISKKLLAIEKNVSVDFPEIYTKMTILKKMKLQK